MESFSVLNANMSDQVPPGYHFHPSFQSLTNPDHDICEGHVIFGSARVLLYWLGMKVFRMEVVFFEQAGDGSSGKWHGNVYRGG